jgi:hypothetical protein
MLREVLREMGQGVSDRWPSIQNAGDSPSGTVWVENLRAQMSLLCKIEAANTLGSEIMGIQCPMDTAKIHPRGIFVAGVAPRDTLPSS